jgi:hypothetical protein
MTPKLIIKKTRQMGATKLTTKMLSKKKYTLEDLNSSPQTIIKFFILQGKAELSMIEDAYIFYKTFSVGNWKSQTLNKKKFSKYFIKGMNFYNEIMKKV